MRWSEGAKKEGYALTLHLDAVGRETVEEFSSCGFVGVYKLGREGGEKGEAEERFRLVVPDTRSTIRSVTSACCVEIAESWGWEVERRVVSVLVARVEESITNGLVDQV